MLTKASVDVFYIKKIIMPNINTQFTGNEQSHCANGLLQASLSAVVKIEIELSVDFKY